MGLHARVTLTLTLSLAPTLTPTLTPALTLTLTLTRTKDSSPEMTAIYDLVVAQRHEVFPTAP